MNPLPFIIAPEILDLLGGEAGARTLLAEQFNTFTCVVCGRSDTYGNGNRVTVVLVIYDLGMGPQLYQLAHPTCSPSRVVIVADSPDSTGSMRVPAMAWLREAGTPAAVLVIAPRVRVRSPAGQEDLMDMLVSSLLRTGFELMTSPDMPLPVLTGRLFIHFGQGHHIQIRDAAGNAFYDGDLPIPDGWAALAELTGQLGVVVVAGIDLEDPGRNRLDDLFAAIRDGGAVGAAIPIGAEQRPTEQTALPAPPAALPPGPQPN